MLIRATFIPFRIILAIGSSSRVILPSVHTIFVDLSVMSAFLDPGAPFASRVVMISFD